MDILVEIFERTKQDLTRKKERVPQRALEKQLGGAATPLPFSNAISNPAKPAPRLIAEIKRRSPSKGLLRPDASPTRLAETYRRSEAAGISILTEPNYFAGSLQDLSQVADLKLGLPLLRKDFLFDPYQLIEARIAGASAVLLITAMLNDEILSELIQFAQELSMTPLVEVHNLEELDRALESGASVLGVNNRNLRDFSVHLETSLRLVEHIPDEAIKVSESGIKTVRDVELLESAGFDAILVGERLMVSEDVGRAARTLSRVGQEARV